MAPTVEDYLRDAFAALLLGDTAERDRLCKLALELNEKEERLLKLASTDPLSKN